MLQDGFYLARYQDSLYDVCIRAGVVVQALLNGTATTAPANVWHALFCNHVIWQKARLVPSLLGT